MDTARKGTGPKRYVRGSILSDSYYHDSGCRFFRHKIDCGRDEMYLATMLIVIYAPGGCTEQSKDNHSALLMLLLMIIRSST